MSKEISQYNNWETQSNLKLEHDPRISALDPMRDEEEEDDYPKFANWWCATRHYFSEAAAEFMGVMVLIIFGNGVICQVVLSGNTSVTTLPHGDWLSLSFGWACGAAIGVWICVGISGAHINPAVTLALATWREFPWNKVPIYIVSQVSGAVVGSAIVYANYFHAIDIVEGGKRTLLTAGLFSSYPQQYVRNLSAFFDEFLATALFVIGILTVIDKHNSAPTTSMIPVAIFILVLGMGVAFGLQTSYALNPARDLGPRIMTSMVGYGSQVFTFRGQYWFWCNIIGTCLGAQAGTFIYDLLIYTGEDSILNKPSKPKRIAHINVRQSQRGKSPAPIPLESMV